MRDGQWVIRGIRLKILENFMEHVVADAEQEIDSIEKRRLVGEFESLEDHDSVIDYPLLRIEIAARAVAHELAVLVESELHAVAHVPWLHSNCVGPKTLAELGGDLTPDTLRSVRMVSDLPISRIINLIDKYYGVSVEQLDSWADIAQLRDAVNDFKHRDNAKHPSDITWVGEDVKVPQYREFTEQQVHDKFESVKRFLFALDKATEAGGRTA